MTRRVLISKAFFWTPRMPNRFFIFFLFLALLSPTITCLEVDPECVGTVGNFALLSPRALLGQFNVRQWAVAQSKRPYSGFYLSVANQKRSWAKKLLAELALRKVTTEEKATAFENSEREINNRLGKMERAMHRIGGRWSEIIINPWQAHRKNVGGGVVIYWGGLGQIVEFRPNGEVYRAKAVITAGNNPKHMTWKAPYTDEGNPIETELLPDTRQLVTAEEANQSSSEGDVPPAI